MLGAVCRYHVTLVNSASEGTNPTNLHTHGLHIPGDGNADDVTRSVPASPAYNVYTMSLLEREGPVVF